MLRTNFYIIYISILTLKVGIRMHNWYTMCGTVGEREREGNCDIREILSLGDVGKIDTELLFLWPWGVIGPLQVSANSQAAFVSTVLSALQALPIIFITYLLHPFQGLSKNKQTKKGSKGKGNKMKEKRKIETETGPPLKNIWEQSKLAWRFRVTGGWPCHSPLQLQFRRFSLPSLSPSPTRLSVQFLELCISLLLLYRALRSLAPTPEHANSQNQTYPQIKGLSLNRIQASSLFWRQLYIATPPCSIQVDKTHIL